MRMAFLLQGMSAYLDASFRALSARGHELLLVHPRTMADAPYEAAGFADYARVEQWTGAEPPAELEATVRDFRPDALMMAGWHHRTYRAIMLAHAGGPVRILFMDNVWNATPKQWLGRLTRRRYIRPYFDCVCVPGDRQEWFALRLGFTSDEVIRGGYTADVEAFDRGRRAADEIGARRAFLFAGRLVPQKGIETLATAYHAYRSGSADGAHPWALHVAGTGPQAAQLAGLPGVTMHGFVQPGDLVDLMHRSSALVFPSVDEHYGVLVHEAAAAGLPLLCTDVAGVAPVMVQDGYNGWVVRSGIAPLWAQAMGRMAAQDDRALAAMSAQSRLLAARLNPAGWARNLEESIARMQPLLTM